MNLEKFLESADYVCGYCIESNDETCQGCPVRKSVDYYVQEMIPEQI